MIRCIANVAPGPYSRGTFEEFQEFLEPLKAYQFDVETNVAKSVVDQRFRTLQFGHVGIPEDRKMQWVIEWDILTEDQQRYILYQLGDSSVVKFIQNAAFEAQILLNYGVILENVLDTMIREKIIYTGYGAVLDEEGATFFSLEGICRRRLGIELDKTYQLLFGHEEPLTPGHIVYAAQDVQHLDIIADMQDDVLEEHYGNIAPADRTIFNHIPTLENETVLGFSEIMWNGLRLDTVKWLENAAEAQPIVDKYRADLEEYLMSDPILNKKAVELGIINLEDKIELNWNSPQQKRQILNYAFPGIPGATQPILKKYLRDNPELQNTMAGHVLRELSTGNSEPLHQMMVEHCRDYLVEHNFLIPPGTIRINWGSPTQVTALLKAIKPNLEDTTKETLNKFPHPIAFALLDYRGAMKLLSSYGEKFLEKMDPDGKVRTRINQILETGRVSSSDPNMQQIPIIPDDDPVVANKYRNCFIADSDDEVFVDSDYSSQELVIIASLSQDPVWMEALRQGHDLHSICAALVYGKEWDRAALPDCKFAASRNKCKCPAHGRLRTGIKTINFGLAYGMSQFKLSATLKISVKEAEALIDKYFNTFPRIRAKLKALGDFAVANGYIMTLTPYNRKRWYPQWSSVSHLAAYHIKGIEFNSLLGSIERTGKNTPIQGGSADMMKLALVLVRRYINKNNLRDKVKIVMQVHDQLTTLAKKDFADEWAIKLTQLMEAAAKVIIPSGLLKAETNITERWSK